MPSEAEIHGFIDDLVARAWGDDITLREWWAALAGEGLSFPHWPEPWGRSWEPSDVAIWRDRLAHHGVIGPPTGLGVLMGGPITIDYGTDEQRARLLPGLADGTSAWCQLFSEPGAGSDLAGLTTTAVRDGDDWVVTGQKVWTSGAQSSDRGMLIARTNWDVPKHRGISYFVMPMDQPGVDVRPLEQMNGLSHFNEVFMDEARVAHDDLIESEGEGWRVATATLGYERRGLGAANVPGPRPAAGERGGQLDRTIGDILEGFRSRHGCAVPKPMRGPPRVSPRWRATRPYGRPTEMRSLRSSPVNASRVALLDNSPSPPSSPGPSVCGLHPISGPASPAPRRCSREPTARATSPASSCRCPRRRSRAAPTRCSATSSASVRSVCHASPRPTETNPSGRCLAMAESGFDIQPGAVIGPVVRPANRSRDAAGSIHDDATAAAAGFRGGTVAGNIHLDHVPPMMVTAYGPGWFERGVVSMYFRHATTHLGGRAGGA